MNDLLAYVSYKGSGSMSEFFSTCRTLGLQQPWTALRSLSELGHLEYSWLEPSGWSVTPPVLALVPHSEPITVLCGARSAELLMCLAANELHLDVEPQPDAPDLCLVRGKTVEHIQEIASAIGLRCPPKPPAITLAQCLSPIDEYIFESSRAVNHPSAFSPHWYDPTSGQFVLRSLINQEGLWRYVDRPSGGRTRYLLVQEEGMWQVGDPDAVRLQLRVSEQTSVRYDVKTQSVLWCTGNPLPRLYARVFVLCSGKLPTREKEGLRFHTVPLSLAMMVLGRLRLTTKEVVVT